MTRRRVPELVVLASMVVFLCAAGTLGVLGILARVDASNARRQTDRLARELRTASRSDGVYAAQLERLIGSAGATSRSMATFMAAVRAQADASNRAVSVLNQAADLFNASRQADAVAVLQGDGTAAVADLEAKTNAVNDEFVAVRDEIERLGGSGG